MVLAFSCGVLSYGQSGSGTIHGTVPYTLGGAISGATVGILDPVFRYQQTVKTDAQGAFTFDKVPYNNYHPTASASGFPNSEQDVDVRSPVPVEAKVSLKVGVTTSSMTVTASQDLIEMDPTTHTDIDRKLFEKMLLESQSSWLLAGATSSTWDSSKRSDGTW